ncbi:MAG: hypothetical protein FWG44_01155 [Oscillospiraceae bacterium]|nr:hypothetical protein [Oscillospiraceae bacterium]
MKRLKHRHRLISNKGELIAETMVSFMILAMLFAAVLMCLNFALRVTGRSIRDSRELQEDVVNPTLLTQYGGDEEDVIIFFAYDDPVGAGIKNASHTTYFYENDDGDYIVRGFSPDFEF